MSDLTPTERRHIRTIRAALEAYERMGGAVQFAEQIEREGKALADAVSEAHQARMAASRAAVDAWAKDANKAFGAFGPASKLETSDAQMEKAIDRAVQRRLATDLAYKNAADAESQAAREEQISEEEYARYHSSSEYETFPAREDGRG